jgi:putative nucleotidyltransferase with HDIG domain
MSNTINTSELRVGMFIHLDLGWMSHPFPLSSFKILSPEQIEVIRGLGKKTVRWVPEKSDSIDAGTLAHEGGRAVAAAAAEAARPAETVAQAAARERREQLARQREATQLCEAQYGEAGEAWRKAFDNVGQRPEKAHKDTERLARALLDKMIGQGEMCIRMLNTASGDRATAHAMNVAVISMLMGRSFGLGETEMNDLGVGALMHDVGKLDLPERVRHHDERFSEAETDHYREHVALGVAQARRMGMSAGAMLVLAQHHECADGSGFPLRLASDRTTAAARIVALVNRFDNLCNPAVLARALTPHEALSTMFAQGRSKFDSTILNAFIRMMGVYPAGSVVQLTDDRFGMVVSVNSSRPLKPCVMVHDVKVPRDEALHLDLETTPDLGIRRSIRAAQLPPAAMEYLAPRPRLAYFFESAAPVLEPKAQQEAALA